MSDIDGLEHRRTSRDPRGQVGTKAQQRLLASSAARIAKKAKRVRFSVPSPAGSNKRQRLSPVSPRLDAHVTPPPIGVSAAAAEVPPPSGVSAAAAEVARSAQLPLLSRLSGVPLVISSANVPSAVTSGAAAWSALPLASSLLPGVPAFPAMLPAPAARHPLSQKTLQAIAQVRRAAVASAARNTPSANPPRRLLPRDAHLSLQGARERSAIPEQCPRGRQHKSVLRRKKHSRRAENLEDEQIDGAPFISRSSSAAADHRHRSSANDDWEHQ